MTYVYREPTVDAGNLVRTGDANGAKHGSEVVGNDTLKKRVKGQPNASFLRTEAQASAKSKHRLLAHRS